MENWVIKNKKADFDRITKQCGISEVVARCLVNKGFEEPEEITAFLNPKKDDMYNPLLMKDMILRGCTRARFICESRISTVLAVGPSISTR